MVMGNLWGKPFRNPKVGHEPPHSGGLGPIVGDLSRRLEGINPGADGPLRTLEALQGRGDAVGDMRV